MGDWPAWGESVAGLGCLSPGWAGSSWLLCPVTDHGQLQQLELVGDASRGMRVPNPEILMPYRPQYPLC